MALLQAFQLALRIHTRKDVIGDAAIGTGILGRGNDWRLPGGLECIAGLLEGIPSSDGLGINSGILQNGFVVQYAGNLNICRQSIELAIGGLVHIIPQRLQSLGPGSVLHGLKEVAITVTGPTVRSPDIRRIVASQTDFDVIFVVIGTWINLDLDVRILCFESPGQLGDDFQLRRTRRLHGHKFNRLGTARA